MELYVTMTVHCNCIRRTSTHKSAVVTISHLMLRKTGGNKPSYPSSGCSPVQFLNHRSIERSISAMKPLVCLRV